MINRIDLSNESLIDTKATSSKGNQLKWLVGGKWYKADHMGYEGLCEVVISRLLEKSNMKDFVRYQPVMIGFGSKEYAGCYSDNFRAKNESIVTLEHLSKQWLANSFAKELLQYEEPKDKIRHTAEFIEKVTKLENVGAYLTAMLELDAFFLNEDRHTNNIAFILNDDTGEYRYCPYFDFGLSLLADTTEDYPMGEDVYRLIGKIHAKPFDRDFDTQLNAAEELFGTQVKLSFTRADIDAALNDVAAYYPADIIERARDILYQQRKKYQYFFNNSAE